MQLGDYVKIKDLTGNLLLSGKITKITDNPKGISLSSNNLLFINPNSNKVNIEKIDFINDIDYISQYLDKQAVFIFYRHNNIDNTFEYDFFMWNEIEPEVKEICELLNQVPGIETYSSCSGHGIIAPWVDFYIKDYNSFNDLLDFLNKYNLPSKTAKHNDIYTKHRFIMGAEGRNTCHLESLEINSSFQDICKILYKYIRKLKSEV